MATGQKSLLLITGASGMLGHALCKQALEQGPVAGIYHLRRPGVRGIDPVQADLCEQGAPERLMNTLKPAAVIHVAAMADVTACEEESGRSENINVRVPGRLASLCAKQEIPFIFVSTDLVFGGDRPPYREKDKTDPLSVYARQKVRAEDLVLKNWPRALVCRLPLMIGVAPEGHYHFCSQMLRAIREDQPLRLFVDEFRTPVDTDSAARGLLLLLGRFHGLFHLGGRTRVSRHTLGMMIAEAMGIAPRMILPVTLDSLHLPVPRARDVSLDSRKAFAAGYTPLALDEGIHKVVRGFLELYKD
jgi:dTDP-4-dehydrorhamnose reductase